MKNIKAANVDDNKLLFDIISNKKSEKRNKLLPYINDIYKRYDFYRINTLTLEQIVPQSAQWCSIRKDLHSCYGNNKYFSLAKKAIFEALPSSSQSKCPYCMLNRHNSFDHFLSKEIYPEFSIYTPNLIPCCSECNTSKGDRLFDCNQNRIFLHFYFDELPVEKYLYIRLTFDNGDRIPCIRVYLDFNFSIHPKLKNLIIHHYESLELLRKYKESVNERLNTIVSEIHNYCKVGLELKLIVQIIEIRYKTLVDEYGINFWEACLYEAILNSLRCNNDLVYQHPQLY